MPLYEYECLECGLRFEKLQRFGAPAPDTCPNGHPQVTRLLSQPAIIFKGSGFYITDNGRNGKRNNKSIPAGSGAKGKEEAKDNATSEKPNASSETSTES